jgi:AraC family transcriptional regulator
VGSANNRYSGDVTAELADGGLRLVATRHAPGEELPWHEHSHRYLTLVAHGGYREETRAGSWYVGRFDAVLHPAGERHRDRFGTAPSELLNVEIDDLALHRLDLEPAALDRRIVLGGESAARLRAILAVELRGPDDLTPLLLDGALLDALAEPTAAPTRSTSRGAPSWLAQLERLLASRFDETWSLPALAREVGVHPQHLNRAFRRHRGTSIGTHVRRLRGRYAAELLASDLPIAEVAATAGFCDQSHLNRAFRHAFGTTPSAWRQAAGGHSRPSCRSASKNT